MCDTCGSATKALSRISMTPELFIAGFRTFDEFTGENLGLKLEFPHKISLKPLMMTPEEGGNYELFGMIPVNKRFRRFTALVKKPDGKWYHMTAQGIEEVPEEKVNRAHF